MNAKKRYYYDEAGLGFGGFFIFIFVILCFLFIGLLAYYLYLNIPGNPEQLNFVANNLPEDNDVYNLEAEQFYPNMKFNHNDISYNFDISCLPEKKDRVISALNEISTQVGILSFHETTLNPDISVLCSDLSKEVPTKENYFIAGEGGAKEIIQTGKYNVITEGMILLFSDKKTIKCDEPNVELHEIMHVFGFNHTTNPDSLMYPLLETCSKKIDDAILSELKRLYSEDNLAELYFDTEDLMAVKKGRYLDFNLTVRNAGDIDADRVTYSIYDNGELVETRQIGDIKYGAGIFIHVENLKLINRDSSEIKFIIDSENKIKEFDKKNNIARISL